MSGQLNRNTIFPVLFFFILRFNINLGFLLTIGQRYPCEHIWYRLFLAFDISSICSCMQKAKYDIGEEAVHRFALSPEDKATLELAEWVDNAFKKASVCSTYQIFHFSLGETNICFPCLFYLVLLGSPYIFCSNFRI